MWPFWCLLEILNLMALISFLRFNFKIKTEVKNIDIWQYVYHCLRHFKEIFLNLTYVWRLCCICWYLNSDLISLIPVPLRRDTKNDRSFSSYLLKYTMNLSSAHDQILINVTIFENFAVHTLQLTFMKFPHNVSAQIEGRLSIKFLEF